MKLDKGLKIALIILLVILLTLVSFGGLYIQKKNSMSNLLKDFKLGMDLNGGRVVTIEVDKTVNTIYYDKDGKVVTEEAKDGTKEEVPVNKDETLTKENYLQTKKIIEKRLSDFGVSEYIIRQNEGTGKMTIKIPEDDNTDTAIQYLHSTGKLTVEDEDGNVLLDNSNLKETKVAYSSDASTLATTVYINFEFNKDSVEKVKEISNTYKHSHEDGEEHSDDEKVKKISIKVDGSSLISTSFDEEISDGVISLSIGSATKDTDTLNSYIKEAKNLAILLNDGNFPVSYTVSQNRYVLSDIIQKDIIIAGIIVIAIILVACIMLAIRYKGLGVLTAIAHIGYVALLLIIIRYTNVIVTIEGLIGVIISIALNYIFSVYLLKSIKEDKDVKKAFNKTIKAMIFILIPALVVGITLCFVNWMPIFSFGEIIFWGIITTFVYNTVLTRTLLICGTKN